MVRRKKAKAASLALVAACLTLSLLQTIAATTPVASAAGLTSVAISAGCPLLPRLLYSFFHASLLHCLVNSWCLLSVVFYYDLPLSSLILAYITAAAFPVDTVCTVLGGSAAEIPAVSAALSVHSVFSVHSGGVLTAAFTTTSTVGLSGICFSLLAQASFHARRKLYFHLYIASFLLFTTAVPYLCSVCGYVIATPNTPLHLYCYVAGLIVGFLNSPAPWQRH